MNINLLSFSNNKKSSHICVKYGSEDVYTAGKSAKCDLTPNWAQFISVAGQRLYTIHRCRLISARFPTVPAELVARPGEFYTDQHVKGVIRSSSRASDLKISGE